MLIQAMIKIPLAQNTFSWKSCQAGPSVALTRRISSLASEPWE